MQRRTFVTSLAAASFCSCAASASEAKFYDIAAGGEPLRDSFNSADDKVRLVLLVSPT